MSRPLRATAFALATMFIVPGALASPTDSPPVDESSPLSVNHDIIEDVVEFVEALQDAQSAEDAANITLAFVSSAGGSAVSALCQYMTDTNLLNLTSPIDVHIADRTVEWRLAEPTKQGLVKVSYHRFKYDPNDLGCKSDFERAFEGDGVIDARIETNLAPEVMRLFYSPPLVN